MVILDSNIGYYYLCFGFICHFNKCENSYGNGSENTFLKNNL